MTFFQTVLAGFMGLAILDSLKDITDKSKSRRVRRISWAALVVATFTLFYIVLWMGQGK